MQQKKIAAEKKKAENQLAYDTIKQFVSENVQRWARSRLNIVAKKFANGEIDKARYHAVMGTGNFPLGEEYSKEIGCWWAVEYLKDYRRVGEYGFGFVNEFFEKNPIERTDYAKDKCEQFIGYMLFHVALPKLFEEEGFVVTHNGCGCCEEIIVELPAA